MSSGRPWRLFPIAATIAAFLFFPLALFAADSWLDRMIQDAGEVKLAPETLAPTDYLIAVYAERMQDIPVSPAAIPRVPGPLASGCLSLVNIETASGQRSLASAAELTFGCTDLPSNAVIHVWTGLAWQPLPTDRRADGRMQTRFSQTATYGLFLVGDVPRI